MKSRKHRRITGIPFALSISIHLFAILYLASFIAKSTKLSYFRKDTSNTLTFRLGQINITEDINASSDPVKASLKEEAIDTSVSFSKENILYLEPRKKIDKKKFKIINPIQGEAGKAHKTHAHNTKANKYVTTVRRRLQENIFYPFQAKMLGMEGKVIISFHVNSDGNIENMKLLSPSPHRLLNDAAFRIVKNSSPFPNPPENFSQTIQVPLTFKIKN